MSGIGYARPTLEAPADFDYFDIGRRDRPGTGSVINWRPVGGYIEAGIRWTWGLEPGTFAFELHPKNPLNDQIRQADIDRNIYQFQAGYHGIPFTGRIMRRQQVGAPGREKFLYSGVCNKKWLQRGYGWVNNFFPPEIQIGLTGKQDIRFGPPDLVMKSYVSSVFTRLGKPVWPALPVRWPGSWTQPELDDIDDLDDLLDILFDAVDEIIGLSARFTQLDELFAQPADRLDLGFSVDLYDGHGTSPQVLNARGLSALQSIIDHNGDNFLNLSKLLQPINNGLWENTADRAGYVFQTHERRDNRKTMFRTDSDGQITSYDLTVVAPEAVRAIVGGKSPSVLNDLIEIGANLAIAAIIAVVSTIPGAGGIAGLTVGVGDLFDDIFFAYQVSADNALEDELGDDDAFSEVFADNTAAYTVDGYAVGKTALHEHGGSKNLEITASSGAVNGRGVSFGAPNGTARRYRVGDVLSFWDRGNVIERHVSGVSVTSKPGEQMRESLTLGSDKHSKGPWTRAIKGIQGLSGTTRGFANSV